MNKYIKPGITIGMMVLIFTAVYYARQNRFDVVACLLLLILYLPTLISELINLYSPYHHQHDDNYYPVAVPHIIEGKPSFKNDVELDIEFYDEGYLTALNELLENILQEGYKGGAGSFGRASLIFVNELPKVKQMGKFVVETNSPLYHGPKVIFVKRYPNE